ncbi:hypothetical protein [Bacillus sp. FJAT-28004]|uniref:hypothetical protein n=1 Tax=Bacillus sp. FJAT-28004 TaxID=1679165 RepID=UPI000A9EBE0A|nr:hypothetical protein [Bacillus sp. FJAT-28004]
MRHTDDQTVFTQTIRDYLYNHSETYDPRHDLNPAREAIRAAVRDYMRLFGSSGQEKGGRV